MLLLHDTERSHTTAMPSSVSPADQVKEVWTSDYGTMAKQTAATRWPGIVQDMIYDVGQTVARMHDGPQQAEGFAIQRALKQMKDEMLQNEVLRYVFMLGLRL